MKVTYIERIPMGEFRQVHEERTHLCHHTQQINGLTYCFTMQGYVSKVIPTEDIAKNYYKHHTEYGILRR